LINKNTFVDLAVVAKTMHRFQWRSYRVLRAPVQRHVMGPLITEMPCYRRENHAMPL